MQLNIRWAKTLENLLVCVWIWTIVCWRLASLGQAVISLRQDWLAWLQLKVSNITWAETAAVCLAWTFLINFVPNNWSHVIIFNYFNCFSKRLRSRVRVSFKKMLLKLFSKINSFTVCFLEILVKLRAGIHEFLINKLLVGKFEMFLL